MPLVPSLAITNAIRDIAGDYLSGGARLFDAVVVAIAACHGVGSVMYIFGHMTWEVIIRMIFLKCLSLCSDNSFAVIFNVSR